MTKYANPLEISSQSDENWGFYKIWPKLAFWPMVTSKLIGGWIQCPDMQMLFEFQVNWIKTEDFRNSAYADLLVYVDLFAYGNHKNNRWLNSVTWNINPLYISSQSDGNWGFRNTTLVVDLGTMLIFWSMLTSKIIRLLNSVTWNENPFQISTQSDENWGFRNFGPNWPFGLCLPQN